MGQRMFVAVVPPEPVCEHLAEFLEARAGMPWIDAEQWHITLAFLASVPEHRIDELAERLAVKAAKVPVFQASLAGAGAFPHPGKASVIWLGVPTSTERVEDGPVAGTGDGREVGPSGEHTHRSEWTQDPLGRLAAKARAAGAVVGAPADGKRFTPHLTLARLRRPQEVSRWVRVLDSYAGPPWLVDRIELVASYLGEGPSGRPRYETIATAALRPAPEYR